MDVSLELYFYWTVPNHNVTKRKTTKRKRSNCASSNPNRISHRTFLFKNYFPFKPVIHSQMYYDIHRLIIILTHSYYIFVAFSIAITFPKVNIDIKLEAQPICMHLLTLKHNKINLNTNSSLHWCPLMDGGVDVVK